MKLTELYPNSIELEKFLWEMANLAPDTTGIPQVMIWASQAQDGAKRHGPRVKVSARKTSKLVPDDLFVLTIQDNPQIVAGQSHLDIDTLEDVKYWTSKNKTVLLKYWNGEISTKQFLDELQTL
jgi:hypothetical protein